MWRVCAHLVEGEDEGEGGGAEEDLDELSCHKRKAMREEGVYGLLRPPFVHCAPPLVINEEELRDGFARVDRALDVLDEEVKRGE